MSEAVHSLNWLSGISQDEDRPPVKPWLQERGLRNILELAGLSRPPEPEAKPSSADEALKELLRGHSTYDVEDGSSSTLALPEPDDVAVSPQVQAVAPPDVCFWLEGDQERMHRDSCERKALEHERRVTVYNGPALLRNRRGYESSIRRLQC